jgi:uncharacterized protein YndB with AHSA1/START domain
MTRTAIALLFVAFTLGNVAEGEVIDAGPGGFSLTHEVTINASRSEVWRAAVEDVGLWWNSSHTISGDARKLRIDARPQGCFCEVVGEHTGVVHLTVTFVNTNVLLRLTGGLGPLGLMGVSGNMTWEFFDAGEGARVVFAYAVGGYRPGGLEDVAAPVDAVVGDALLRLKAHVETGNADNAAAN